MRTKRAQNDNEVVTSKKQKQKTAENQENEDPQTDKYASLKAKYDALKNLRETEAEKLYNALKKSAEEREEAANKLITQLKEEKAKLEKKLTSKPETKKESKDLYNLQLKVSELESYKKGNDERTDGLLNLINFYEEMSAVKITPIERNKFECLIKNTKNGREFMFELAVVNDEIEFTPITDNSVANLPDLFTDTICFTVQELPVFISKLITHMYK